MVACLLPYLAITELVDSLALPTFEVALDVSLDSRVTFAALFLLC